METRDFFDDDGPDGRLFARPGAAGGCRRSSRPEREPNREIRRFFETAAQPIDVGYRPCRARRSLGEPAVAAALAAIEARLASGFASAGGFRAAFTELLGAPPPPPSGDASLWAHGIETPLGPMLALADGARLHLLEFLDREAPPGELAALRKRAQGEIAIGGTEIAHRLEAELDAYFAGRSARFTVPLAWRGGAFAQSVWRALREIPAGETRSYRALAEELGRPRGARAVARANAANTLAIVVPCHRVIGADGALTGYGGGLWRKRRLLEIERSFAAPG